MKKITVENIESMSKEQLRAACKDRGIKYGKLSNLQMREALVAAVQGESVPPVVTTPASTESPAVPAPVAAAAKKPTTPKAPREEQNGVKKPGPGKCLDVWEAMQALYDSTGKVPTTADATVWAKESGANPSNASQELSRWRKFSGLTNPAKVGDQVQDQPA